MQLYNTATFVLISQLNYFVKISCIHHICLDLLKTFSSLHYIVNHCQLLLELNMRFISLFVHSWFQHVLFCGLFLMLMKAAQYTVQPYFLSITDIAVFIWTCDGRLPLQEVRKWRGHLTALPRDLPYSHQAVESKI